MKSWRTTVLRSLTRELARRVSSSDTADGGAAAGCRARLERVGVPLGE